MLLDIVELGAPILREQAREVTLEEIQTAEFRQFVDDLVETMQTRQGAGLAAPQVGRSIQVFAAGVKNNTRYPYRPEFPLTIAINPQITFLTEEWYLSNEGCLSIPNLRCVVKRCPLIRFEALDRDGVRYVKKIGGVKADTFQHEHDHLNGILIVDRVEDPRSFTTWDNFGTYYEANYRLLVQQVEAEYAAWEDIEP